MERKLKHIDVLFREGLGDYAEAPPPPVWDALEKRLDDDKKRRAGFLFSRFWFVLLLALVSVGGGAMYAWKMAGNGPAQQLASAASSTNNGVNADPAPVTDGAGTTADRKSNANPAEVLNSGGNKTTTGSLARKIVRRNHLRLTADRSSDATSARTSAQTTVAAATQPTAPGERADDRKAPKVNMDNAIAMNTEASAIPTVENPVPVKATIIRYVVRSSAHNNMNVAEAEPILESVREQPRHENLLSNPVEDDEEEVTVKQHKATAVTGAKKQASKTAIAANHPIHVARANPVGVNTYSSAAPKPAQRIAQNTATRSAAPLETKTENAVAVKSVTIARKPDEAATKPAAVPVTTEKKAVSKRVKKTPETVAVAKKTSVLTPAVAPKAFKPVAMKTAAKTSKAIKPSKLSEPVASNKPARSRAKAVAQTVAANKNKNNNKPSQPAQKTQLAAKKSSKSFTKAAAPTIAAAASIDVANQPAPVKNDPITSPSIDNARPQAPSPIANAAKDSTPNKSKPADSSSTAAASDSTHKKPRTFFGFEVGIKAGFESGMSAGTAQKFVASPYLERKLTNKLSLLIQPAIKYANLKSKALSGKGAFYEVDNASTVFKADSMKLVDTSGAIIGWMHFDAISQSRTNVTKTYSVGGGYLEFEVPFLLKYSLTSKFSVYGGVNLSYSKLIGIHTNTTKSDPVSAKGDTTYFTPVGAPQVVYDHNMLEHYTGTPSANFKPVYESPFGSSFRVGYMLGFNYQFNKRWLADILVQKANVKSDMRGGYDINSALSGTYFRISLGYKLFQ